MRIKILVIASLFSFLLAAQELGSPASIPGDTQQVNRLWEQAMSLRFSDLPAAIRCAKDCYHLAVQTGSAYYRAKATNLVSILKYQSGEYSEAASLMKKALQLRIQAQDTLGQAISLVNLGNMYSEMKRTEVAFACYEKALKLAQRINNSRWTKGALLSIASLQVKAKRYGQARGNFLTLLEMKDSDDAELDGICYTNLGICLLNLGDTLGAESYQQQALDVMDMSGEEVGKADAYINLAEIYRAKKDYPSALGALKKALAIAQKNKYNEGLVNAWRSLSSYYANTNEYRLAYLYLSKSDSAVTQNNASLNEGMAGDDWETDEETPARQEVSFFSAENAWQIVLIGALALLLIVVFKQFSYEQKEQEA